MDTCQKNGVRFREPAGTKQLVGANPLDPARISMRTAAFVIFAIACIGIGAYALIGYTFFQPGALVHPQMRAVYSVHRLGIMTHVVAAGLALLLGPWQFISALRRRSPRLHRQIGTAYLALGVLPGGAAGFYMSWLAFGGMVSHTGFALGSLLWLATGVLAFTAAKARRFEAHRDWMIRNFALTFAAVTLRVQLGSCFGAGLRFEDFYPILAWSSWIPNLIVAELIVRSLRSGGNRAH
jgi:hypothetical protein